MKSILIIEWEGLAITRAIIWPELGNQIMIVDQEEERVRKPCFHM